MHLSSGRNMEVKTKICPFCAEVIKIEAVKCRYCREWLNERKANDKRIQETSILHERLGSLIAEFHSSYGLWYHYAIGRILSCLSLICGVVGLILYFYVKSVDPSIPPWWFAALSLFFLIVGLVTVSRGWKDWKWIYELKVQVFENGLYYVVGDQTGICYWNEIKEIFHQDRWSYVFFIYPYDHWVAYKIEKNSGEFITFSNKEIRNVKYLGKLIYDHHQKGSSCNKQ
jgi:hypothetical protein